MTLVKAERVSWYKDLIHDCRRIIEEAKTNAGKVLVEAKYDIGNRILPDYEKFGRSEYGHITLEDLARELETDRRRIGENISFAEKVNTEYGDFTQFQLSADASALSWRRLLLEWLPSRRGRRRFSPVDTPELPQGIFNVIYADPPWRYQFTPTYSREVEKNYPTMSLDDICALQVPVAEDAILFLWATSPKLEEAMRVLEEWGFEYRTSMVWVKDRIGMGHYVRGQHEFILIGRKGTMRTPEESDRPSSVIMSPRREHSQKPDEVYELIERMYPTGTYLELFSRGDRLNWTMWGKEAEEPTERKT